MFLPWLLRIIIKKLIQRIPIKDSEEGSVWGIRNRVNPQESRGSCSPRNTIIPLWASFLARHQARLLLARHLFV